MLHSFVVAAVAIAALAISTSATGAGGSPAGDVARYILPPGNYGGIPTTANSRDQLPLYDALTPLKGNVTNADIQRDFLPENFQPIGKTTEIATGRPGLKILYDQYGIPHIYGKTRADVAFGAGYVTARDRMLLLQLGRGPARAAVADVPGIDAFSLVTSGQSFVPSAATEALVSQQVSLLVKTYGSKGRQIVADAQSEADGANAYITANHIAMAPITVDDVIAVTAFIGSIFGSGGGAEAQNANFLAQLQASMGKQRGYEAWDDAMMMNDPEAPTTIKKSFKYGEFTGGPVRGSVVIDANSIVPLDPRQPAAGAASVPASAPAAPANAPTAPASAPAAKASAAETGIVDASKTPPHKEASNFLVVNPSRSATGDALAVMGPQLGYYYPEIVQQIDLHGPGYQAQGIGVPGLAMYVLIGRTPNYAWSLTSADQDVRDVFAEQLCNPDGSAPTRASTHYMYKGQCRPLVEFDAGTLNGTPIRYPTTVHGPVIGTATVHGQPYALARQRSTFGRDALNLAALKDMTDGVATTPQKFFDTANEFGFTFNWAYASRTTTAYFSTGQLPRRAPGLDRRLPTLGNGLYDWRGFLSESEHPHDTGGPGGLFLNWNNKSAPDFMHGDDTPFGSIQHVLLFSRFPRKVQLADDVSIMNRAATSDGRNLVWPEVSKVLRTGAAPNALDQRALDVLDDWVQRDAPRVDANLDGKNDDAGAPIMDAVWLPIAQAVMSPVYGDQLSNLNAIRGLNGQSGWSLVDKDLRTLLDPAQVKGKFNLRYCGEGSLAACRTSLWSAFNTAIQPLVSTQGSDPAAWRGNASRTGFIPGLIPDTMRTTNRPTFQQVLQFAPN